MITFAALNAANENATRGLHFDIACALGEAADNAVDSVVLVGNDFVYVGSNQSPLFDRAALASLETVMSCNVLGFDKAQHAAVAKWLAARGFTF